MSLVEKITKTEAAKRARDLLRRGHFQSREGAYVFYEGERIHLYATMGRLSPGEMAQQLANAIYDRHQEDV